MTSEVVTQSIIDENLIERRPVFSEDGNKIYIIDRDHVKEFGLESTECSCTFSQDEDNSSRERSNVVGIALQESNLYACTSNCTLIRWSIRKGEMILKAKRQLAPNRRVFDMTIVDYDHDSGQVKKPELFVLIEDRHVPDMIYVQVYSLAFALTRKFSYRGRPHPKCVALGSVYDLHYIATALERDLYVYHIGPDTKHKYRFSNSSHNWEVVRTQPFTDTIAAGDSCGKVHLYQNIFERPNKYPQNYVAVHIYHWHSSAVYDIAFSPCGAYMYTGGIETVLVKWNVRHPEMKQFVPRLQSEIVHISVSPTNTSVAVSLADNGIVLINAQMHVMATIQKLTWSLAPIEGQQILPAKLCYDPNSRCLVLNGRHGHLQFVSLERNELVYSMDITETNYTREPDTTVYYMEVVKVALSGDGLWMATVEMRDDHETTMEVVMKMWWYDNVEKRFTLNTCVNLPHYSHEITALRFQPVRESSLRPNHMLVTSGSDRKFRVWMTSRMQLGSKGEWTTTWTNERVGFYRDKEGGPVAFSSDGSVLAVGFGSSLTVWNADTIEMSASLTRGSEPIRFIEFEQKASSHLVVSASACALQVWNLLSLTVVWSVNVSIQSLAVDPLTDHFAAFTDPNQLFVFKAASAHIVHKMDDVSASKASVIAAIFVPRPANDAAAVSGGGGCGGGVLPGWTSKSKLYYVTAAQELLAIDVNSSTSWSPLPTVTMDDGDLAMRGAFAQLAAKQLRHEENDLISTELNAQRIGTTVEESARKLLRVPIQSMPHISLLCEEFLTSHLTSKDYKPPTDEEVIVKQKKKKKKKLPKNKDTNGNLSLDDVSLENLFFTDTQPNLDLLMDCN